MDTPGEPGGVRALGLSCGARFERCVSVDHDLLLWAGVPPEVVAAKVDPQLRLCTTCVKLYCWSCYVDHVCVRSVTH